MTINMIGEKPNKRPKYTPIIQMLVYGYPNKPNSPHPHEKTATYAQTPSLPGIKKQTVRIHMRYDSHA